jgi:hypothetical protein
MKVRFPVTSAASVVAVAVISAAVMGDVDIVKLNVEFFRWLEPHEIDDVAVSLGLIFVGLVIDCSIARRRAKQEAEVQTQRLHILKATMRTVQDIVNNFLNNMQLFRMEAEAMLSAESVELFDELVQDTSAKLKALGDLQDTPEIQMAAGPVIDYEREPVSTRN